MSDTGPSNPITRGLAFAPPQTTPAGLDMSRNIALPDAITQRIKIIQARIRHRVHPSVGPMPIVAGTGTIFVRIPKNASNSLLSVLYPGTAPAALPHYSADYYRRVFPTAFRRSLVFAPIRHPLDRFASAFSYYRNHTRRPEERYLMDVELPFLRTLEDFVTWLNDQEDLGRVPIMRWHHFHRQTAYVCDQKGRVITDLLFPVEDMSEGLNILTAYIGQAAQVQRLNTSQPLSWDGLPIDRIAAHYADDLALWDRVAREKVILTAPLPVRVDQRGNQRSR